MSAPVVLVADDDRSIRTVLGQALGRNGYEVRTTPSASTLWQWVEAGEGDLVITDVVMPEENGLDLLQRIRTFRPDLRVIVMSAQSTLVTAVKATQRGAFEYLPKPFDLTELLAVVERALEEPVLTFEEGGEPAPEERMPLLGRSVPMQDIYRVIARLTTSDLTVMITGESGTGKELVARALHDYGHRRTGPFVAVNLAAIPKDRIETELFGQESGGGRVSGRFEQAAGGTLFLDEVGDMPPEAQIRLLRVLQDGEFTVTGGRRAIRANVRIIAATQKDLRQAIAAGTFREDLFYRLDVVPIRVPPLRDRVEDIPLLARHFLDEAQEEGHTSKTLTPDALDRLQSWRWPGNVRELANLMQRIVALHPQESVTAALIEAELAGAQPETTGTGGPREEESLADVVTRHIRRYLAMGDEHGDGLHTALHEHIIAEVERPLLRVVLEATRGNQIRAAAILGLNRNTLRKKIRELDIPLGKGP